MKSTPDLENTIQERDWGETGRILKHYPHLVTSQNVRDACIANVPLDVLESMLDQQPNAPLEEHCITFNLIETGKLEYFRAVLDHCPAATEVKNPSTYLSPLLVLFRKKELINADWIGPILKANPNAAKQQDFDGKTPLHWAYQRGASSELIHMLLQAHPDGENTNDNLGRFPKDLENQSERDVFTPASETLIIVDKVNVEKQSYPNNAVVVCRGDMLVRDLQEIQNEGDKLFHREYSRQVLVRHRIFETLLDEFSKMVGIDDKDVIQKAAAVQALAVHYLSNQDGTIINFGSFDNPGYWYQQEVLKLVMRVYYEAQPESVNQWLPSTWGDAKLCMEHLERRKNGEASLTPSDKHAKAYDDLTQWLTKGLDTSSHTLQGPVIKPLQSLFNKLFICRGQTSVSVIGDLVRATLLVDDGGTLQEIVKRIKNTFPNITENQFRQPGSFNGLVDFLTYVHDDLTFLPDNDNVLPYRFKPNSSQKKIKDPLWYNFNFFLQVPEYHRVGLSEIFVACEL